MGSANSSLTEDILEEYTVLTYLSRSEIISLLKRFEKAFGDSVNLQDTDFRYHVSDIEKIFPQITYNPFKDRIIRVFSSRKDNHFSFEDTLDMCSVMSERCPNNVKALWAFRIFDYDEDDLLTADDLSKVIDRLIPENTSENIIKPDEKKKIVDAVLKEMDLDSSGNIGQLEFVHAAGKMPEFASSFCFRL